MGENLYGKLGPGWIAPGLTFDKQDKAVEVPPAPPVDPVVVPIVDTVPKSKEKTKPVFVDEPVIMPPPQEV